MSDYFKWLFNHNMKPSVQLDQLLNYNMPFTWYANFSGSLLLRGGHISKYLGKLQLFLQILNTVRPLARDWACLFEESSFSLSMQASKSAHHQHPHRQHDSAQWSPTPVHATGAAHHPWLHSAGDRGEVQACVCVLEPLHHVSFFHFHLCTPICSLIFVHALCSSRFL